MGLELAEAPIAHQNTRMEHARELEWLERSVGVRVLRDRALISVTGDDAAEWLQGQVTNQTAEAHAGSAIYAFILTLKGRVLADTWALFRDGEIWLDVPATHVDAVLERLDRYIIMEDVDLAHLDGLVLFAAEGPLASTLSPEGWPASRLGAEGRTWVVSTADVDIVLAEASSAANRLGGGFIQDDAWSALHVLRGRPRFGVDFGEHTYPQETGLTALAVSFNKGCYVGQETVVMLQNRGKAPKTLWRWVIDAPEVPPPKTPITRGGDEVGEVTSAIRGEGGVLALGFLKRGQDAGPGGFEVLGAAATAERPVSVA